MKRLKEGVVIFFIVIICISFVNFVNSADLSEWKDINKFEDLSKD